MINLSFDREIKAMPMEFWLWCTCWPDDGIDVDFPERHMVTIPPQEPATPDTFGRLTSYVPPDEMTWVEHLSQDIGWDEVIARDQRDLAMFLIENGIAPEQPFLVRIHNYQSWQSGYETPEWDEDWEADVMQVMRWSPERVIAAWEEWLCRDNGYMERPAT
jgi:hypothetical protein